MEYLDFTFKPERPRVFIPRVLVEDQDVTVNEKQDNWMNDESWTKYVNKIIKVNDGLIVVIFHKERNEHHPKVSLYKGIIY